MEIILHTKNIPLHSKNETRIKKTNKNSTFDATTGPHDGAENRELPGPLIPSHIQKQPGKQVGPHRDDGPAAPTNNPRTTENKKKELCKIPQNHNSKITIEANKKAVNRPDTTPDLNNHICKPY